MTHSMQDYTSKHDRLVAGIMSGTSLDGIDVAFVQISGSPASPAISIRHFHCVPFSETTLERLHRAAEGQMTVWDAAGLDADLGCEYAGAVLQAATAAGIPLHDLDAIGLHGQTVYHNPGRTPAGVTLQIGSPAYVAQMTGTPVVNQFRLNDVAAGGQGAPLVPYCDYLLLSSGSLNRIVLNIGGIANVTWLPAQALPADVTAFDTGPGNMLIDLAMQTLYDSDYDDEGAVAATGSVHNEWLRELLSEPFFSQKPPKSTGRELFGQSRGAVLIREARALGISSPDIVTTLTCLSASSIAEAVVHHAAGGAQVHELIVSGGGARNTTLLRMLEDMIPGTALRHSAEFGLPGDAKEAVCFAILADHALHGLPANLPGVTGAGRPVVCGSITLP